MPGITQLDPDHHRDPLSALRHYYRLFARLTRGGARRIVTRVLSDVSLFTDVDGFTIRLVERRAP